MTSQRSASSVEPASGHAIAKEILEKYNYESGFWRISQKERFWKVIGQAKKDGLTGKGQKIAILDTSVDPKYFAGHPDIKIHNLTNADDSLSAHGTAVTLLAKEIAPEASIDHFVVFESDGNFSFLAFKKALEICAEKNVDYVCMSLGDCNKNIQTPKLDKIFPEPVARNCFQLIKHVSNHELPSPICLDCDPRTCMCKVIDEVAQNSNCVFIAAAGNSEGKLFCPAISKHCISIGYIFVNRTFIDKSERRDLKGPNYPQSFFLDFALEQQLGMLGSSFAAPLVTGAMALRNKPRPIRQLLKPNILLKLAQPYSDYIEASHRIGCNPDANAIQQYTELFPLFLGISGDAGSYQLTPSQKLECRLFNLNTIINSTLSLCQMQFPDFDKSIVEIFKWAGELAPWELSALGNYVRIRIIQLQKEQLELWKEANNPAANLQALDRWIKKLSTELDILSEDVNFLREAESENPVFAHLELILNENCLKFQQQIVAKVYGDQE